MDQHNMTAQVTFTSPAEDGPVLADAGLVRHAAGSHHHGLLLETPEGGHTQPGHQGEALVWL